MIRLRNHLAARPDTTLTGKIRATELLEPGSDGLMSSHKIWIPPNEAYPPHLHPAPHVIVILEGGGNADIGGEQTELRTGDVFYVPGKVRHQVGADERGMLMLAVSVGSLSLTDPRRLVVME